jgi:hypothetical protein
VFELLIHLAWITIFFCQPLPSVFDEWAACSAQPNDLILTKTISWNLNARTQDGLASLHDSDLWFTNLVVLQR